MAHTDETFFTAVGCMDGRVQKVIADFGSEKFGAAFPDTVTEAGLVGLLAKENIDTTLLNLLRFKVVDVSIGKHHSIGVIVHGHAECAGNPVDDEKQKDDIRRSVTALTTLVGSVPILGVFVHRDESDSARWIAEEVPQTLPA